MHNVVYSSLSIHTPHKNGLPYACKITSCLVSTVDMGDHVVVINAKSVVLTGKKWDDKLYRHHTGWAMHSSKIRLLQHWLSQYLQVPRRSEGEPSLESARERSNKGIHCLYTATPCQLEVLVNSCISKLCCTTPVTLHVKRVRLETLPKPNNNWQLIMM